MTGDSSFAYRHLIATSIALTFGAALALGIAGFASQWLRFLYRVFQKKKFHKIGSMIAVANAFKPIAKPENAPANSFI